MNRPKQQQQFRDRIETGTQSSSPMKCFYFSLPERKPVGESRKAGIFSWARFSGPGLNLATDSQTRSSVDLDTHSTATSQIEISKKAASSESTLESDLPSSVSQGPSTSSSFVSASSQSPHSSSRPPNLRVFTQVELKSATKNFNKSNLLGEGGFGCVYKGSIRHAAPGESEVKMDVAVKQLKREGQQGHKEWLAEVQFLGVVDHPSLVRLVGYCAEDDERGIQRLLVYEFMSNKSLAEHLFRKGPPVLSWNLRLSIALGAARGLTYLHEEMKGFQVIFRDFKTSNVLLDDEFNPKLSDFGLARKGPNEGLSHVSTAVCGTIGYAAPEYIQTGHLTTKSDVWSFGIFLLELLSGRRAVDRNLPKSEQHLVEWAKPYLHDAKKFPLMIDRRLGNDYCLPQARHLSSLASKCLAKQGKSRPKMSDVVKTLAHIVETGVTSLSPSPNRATNGHSQQSSNTSAKRKPPVESKSDELAGSTWRGWTRKQVIA